MTVIEIIKESDYNISLFSKEEIPKLLVPFDEYKMTAYTASIYINSAKNNHNIPDLIIKFEF